MKKLLLCALLFSAAVAVNAADQYRPTGSFEQLLSQAASYEGEIPAVPAALPGRAASARNWVTVQAADKYARTRLLEAGFDIVEVRRGQVAGFADSGTMAALAAAKFTILGSVPAADHAAMTRDFPAGDAVYHNYQETYDALKQMASANPDVASLFSIGKTVEGRDIWCLRLNSGAKGEAPSSKPGAFLLGNLHAREHLANEVPLLIAAWLLDNRSNPEVRKYLSTLDIYVVPMANPDGAEYDIKTGSYQYYRKNMAKNSGGSRGVDLNRNFDSWWCQSGASTYPGSDTYCGPKAFSEPESQNIKRFMEGRRNLRTHITYHTYGSLVLYPWGGSDDPVPDEKDRNAFIKAADAMARLTGYEPLKSSEMYVATGDSADWAYAATKALSFTIELEGRGFYPGAAIVKTAVEKNLKAAMYLLSITDDPYKVL